MPNADFKMNNNADVLRTHIRNLIHRVLGTPTLQREIVANFRGVYGFGKLFGVSEFRYFIFPLTNKCNLHCEGCSTLSNVNMPKWELLVDDVELFCELFKGVGEESYHRLSGGEPTCASSLTEIVEVFWSNNRRIWLMTNGFGVLDLQRTIVNKIEKITFDDHGINHAHVLRCIRYLKRFYQGQILLSNNKYHYNLMEAKTHKINKGKKCNAWLRTPVLQNRVVYPCCSMQNIALIDSNPTIADKLVQAGWTIDNPNLVETLKNWRETLPYYIIDQCLNNCWRPNVRVGSKLRITLKRNDQIRKMEAEKVRTLLLRNHPELRT